MNAKGATSLFSCELAAGESKTKGKKEAGVGGSMATTWVRGFRPTVISAFGVFHVIIFTVFASIIISIFVFIFAFTSLSLSPFTFAVIATFPFLELLNFVPFFAY